jgi:hypothetical protein
MPLRLVLTLVLALALLQCSAPLTHQSVTLRNNRGGEVSYTTDDSPVLVLDVQGLPVEVTYRVQVLDAGGIVLSDQPATRLRDVAVAVVTARLRHGYYAVRLVAGQDAIREFGMWVTARAG